MKPKIVGHIPVDGLWVILIDDGNRWHHVEYPSKKKATGAIRYFKRHYKGKKYRDKYDDYYRGVL